MMEMPRVGTDFAGYHVQGILGRGGMSVVYQAEHPRLARVVALKVLAVELAEDDRFRERFVRESRLAASLDHPNIVPIYDAGSSDDLLFIAMRFVKGDLKSLLQKEGRLRPERALPVITQVASALDAAHHLGLVHRDVKPANILIAFGSGMDGQDHVYLADFGLTKHATSRSGITGTGQFVGTVDYMAPEQIEGKEVDSRVDVYALGCIVYECITGRVPFTRENDAAVIWAHLKEDPPRPSDLARELPSGVDDVVAKAMGKDADDRYSSCMALVAAFREAVGVGSYADHRFEERAPSSATVLRARPSEAAGQAPSAPAAFTGAGEAFTGAGEAFTGAGEAFAGAREPVTGAREPVPDAPRPSSAPAGSSAGVPWEPAATGPSGTDGRPQSPAAPADVGDVRAPRASRRARPSRSALGIAAVVVAVIAAAAAASLLLPDGGPSGQPRGEAAPAGKLTASVLVDDATRDLKPIGSFPDPVEALFLVAHVGADNVVRWDCARPEAALEDAVRAITCSPGAPISQASFSLFHDGFRLRDYFRDLYTGQGATTGGEGCAGTEPWRGSWSIGPETWAHAVGGGHGEYKGKVLCYKDSTGAPHVAWIDYATKIFAEATGTPGSEANLYDWWLQEAGPGHPQHIHGLEEGGMHAHEAHVIAGEKTVTGTVLRFEKEGPEITSVYLKQADGTETEVYFDPNRNYECDPSHLVAHKDSGAPVTLPYEKRGNRLIATHFTHC
jgi:hypothetical protein